MWRIIYIKRPKNLDKEQLERIKTKWFITMEEAIAVKRFLEWGFPESEWEIVEITSQELFI